MKYQQVLQFSCVIFTTLCIGHCLATDPIDPSELPAFACGNRLTGVVLRPDGQPAEGAEVFLLPNPDGAYILPVNPLANKAQHDGSFTFTDLKDGGYQIWAETDTHTSLVRKLGGRKVKILQDASEPGGLEIPLHVGCGYDVTVCSVDGQSIPGATISFGWTDIDRSYETGQDGLAKLRNLSRDDWYFVVKAEGYATQFHKTSKQNLGSILPLQFDLQPGGEIAGVVRDEAGNPVAGARIFVNSATTSMSPHYARVISATNGEFAVQGLPLGQAVRVTVDKANYLAANTTVAVIDDHVPKALELTLPQRPYGGNIRVSVLDEQGQPIENASVSNPGRSSADLRTGTTDALGLVLLQDVFESYAGYLVCAKAKGFVPQQKSATVLGIGRGDEVVFNLVRGNLLRGRILNPEGEPMPKLRVYFNRGENGDPLGGRVDTDSDGRFEIDGLGPRALITVYTPAIYAPIRQIDVRTDLDELMEMTLQPAGVLLVRAVDELSGDPIAEFNVRIGRCEEPLAGDVKPGGIPTSLIEDGINIQGDTKEYRLENQVIGTAYKVTVSAKGYEPITLARIVTQDINQAKPVDIALTKLRSENYQAVAGRLLDADGNPIAGAAVRLLVGREIPRVNSRGRGNPMGGWKFYHWGLLSGDDIEGRDQCEQLFKTVSDQDGKFRIEGVKRDMPWLELFYFGEGIFAQRYSNLSERSELELQDLELLAEHPASLEVRVDRIAYPNAASLSLTAADYVNGINAIKLPFASEHQSIDLVNTFERLPAGTYTMSLQAPPEPTGGGGYMVKSIATQTISIEAGKQNSIKF